VAFTVREGILKSCSALIVDGPNSHVRATLMCTDGPADVFHIMIMNEAAKHLAARFEGGQNPTLVVAGHLHPWTDEQGVAQVELALTHLGVSLPSEFVWPNRSETQPE
jgi:hypothetical protein